jgi:hypothetical protein
LNRLPVALDYLAEGSAGKSPDHTYILVNLYDHHPQSYYGISGVRMRYRERMLGCVLGLGLVACATRTVSQEEAKQAGSATSEKQSTEHVPGLPQACSKVDVAKYGRPVMFSDGQGVNEGVSVLHSHFKKNEPAIIYIWLSNESEGPVDMFTCCEFSFLRNIQVLDASGHRVASSFEMSECNNRETGKTPIRVCTCSGPLTHYAPGSCGVVDFGTLNRPDTAYDLAPGKYTVTQKSPLNNDPFRPVERAHTPTRGLVITIEKE